MFAVAGLVTPTPPPLRDRRARALAAVAVVLGALGLSVVASWPLAWWSGQVFVSSPDMPDLNTAMWLPWHLSESLRLGHSPFDAPGLQYPYGQRITLLVWNLGIQVLQLPLYWMLDPVRAYNLSLIALGAGNALGGYAIGRALVPDGGRAPALAAAVLLVASPFAWNELAQGRAEQGFLGLFALVIAATVHLHRDPDRRVAVLAGLAWGAAGLCYWFYGYFLVLVVGLVWVAALGQRRLGVARALALAGGVAALVAAPAALLIIVEAAASSSVYQVSQAPSADQARTLANVVNMASLGLAHLSPWPLSPPDQLREVVPMISMGVVLAAVVPGIGRRAWGMAALAITGIVLALGPTLQWTPQVPVTVGAGSTLQMPLVVLQDVLPGFSRMWWPYRFQVFWVVGAAGCAAAVAALPRRGLVRWIVAGVLSLFALGELRLAQSSTHGGLVWDAPVRVVATPFFDAVGARPGEHPLLFLPYQAPSTGRVGWQMRHRQPMSIGLADSDDLLVPIAVQEAIDADPVLTWLKALGRRQTAGAPPLTGTALRAHLKGLGFHYVVYWRAPPQPGQDALYKDVFGGAPDHITELVWAWKL